MGNLTATPSQRRNVSFKGKQLSFQNGQRSVWRGGVGRLTSDSPSHSWQFLGRRSVSFSEGCLPPSVPPGLHGPATSSSAEPGEASSGKPAGVWIHFLVVQTVAFPQWAGMENTCHPFWQLRRGRERDKGCLSFHKHLEARSHLTKD